MFASLLTKHNIARESHQDDVSQVGHPSRHAATQAAKATTILYPVNEMAIEESACKDHQQQQTGKSRKARPQPEQQQEAQEKLDEDDDRRQNREPVKPIAGNELTKASRVQHLPTAREQKDNAKNPFGDAYSLTFAITTCHWLIHIYCSVGKDTHFFLIDKDFPHFFYFLFLPNAEKFAK
jgi:hypothetical protein